ncbi:hypothetical protein, partial [Aquabacterium sp.]|uniref:hypothetical protein n=1 Tax=Aquabacterium sp. TaxID=1872578 RepID=UPI0019CB0D85
MAFASWKQGVIKKHRFLIIREGTHKSSMKTLAAPLSKGDGELRDLVDKRDAKRRALARTWHMMETKAKHPTMAQDQRPSKAPSHPSWLTPLVNLARGIFVAQVQLERREGKL